jgi:hypothetical protein
MNHSGFTVGQNSRRIARHTTELREDPKPFSSEFRELAVQFAGSDLNFALKNHWWVDIERVQLWWIR